MTEGIKFPCDTNSHGEKAILEEVFMTALYILFPLDNTEIIINSESNTNAEQYFLYVKVSHRCI